MTRYSTVGYNYFNPSLEHTFNEGTYELSKPLPATPNCIMNRSPMKVSAPITKTNEVVMYPFKKTLFLLIPALLLSALCLTSCSQSDVQPVSGPEPDSQAETAAEQDSEELPDTSEAKMKQIEEGMEKACRTDPAVTEMTSLNPTDPTYRNIRSIVFDGLDRNGMKTKVFAYIGVPPKASAEKKVPGVVLVHGGGGHPFLEWVKIWNDRGYAAICVDTVGFYPECPDANPREGMENSHFLYGLFGDFAEEGYTDAPNNDGFRTSDGPVEDMWMYYAVSDTILASNILRQDERIDPEKIGITGISWGGVITSLTIGYDSRFAFAIPVYGSGYLSESLASLWNSFTNGSTPDLWAAEDRFDSVTMPVLWLCWNDDRCFSLNSNSDSYLATKGNNPLTRLSMRNEFGHSHNKGWNAPESYTFANSVVKGGAVMAGFAEEPAGRDIHVRLDPADRGNIKATLYYITEPMTYSDHEKYGVVSSFMDQIWQTLPLEYDKETHTVTGTVPEEAAGYYIELSEKAEIITSSYVSLSD